jgi:hypothetical protein
VWGKEYGVIGEMGIGKTLWFEIPNPKPLKPNPSEQKIRENSGI